MLGVGEGQFSTDMSGRYNQVVTNTMARVRRGSMLGSVGICVMFCGGICHVGDNLFHEHVPLT